MAADCADFIALASRSRRFHRGLAHPPATEESFAVWLARCRRPDHVTRLIRREEDGAIVGAIEISQIVLGRLRSGYLGYWLGRQYTGKGYMTEALRLAVSHAFRVLRLHRIEANIQPDNIDSIRLVRRLGFVREGYSRRYLKIGGRWRDHERWAILAKEWLRRPARAGQPAHDAAV